MARPVKDNKIGEKIYNSYGSEITIIKYNKYNDIIMKFDNGYIKHGSYKEFKNKSVKSPYCKSVYGIGYIGEGKYKVSINGKSTKPYQYWISMIRRCYSNTKIDLKKNYVYKDCSVCEEWHNFQNFGKWFDDNFYTIDGERICLDKDILVKGNKTYSPKTCCFVPERINLLFTKNNKIRGKYPIGVSLGNNKKYKATINIFDFVNNKKQLKHLGYFDNIEDAFNIYKKSKENNIKRTADYYKNIIPQKLYDAMYSWEVNIND